MLCLLYVEILHTSRKLSGKPKWHHGACQRVIITVLLLHHSLVHTMSTKNKTKRALYTPSIYQYKYM